MRASRVILSAATDLADGAIRPPAAPRRATHLRRASATLCALLLPFALLAAACNSGGSGGATPTPVPATLPAPSATEATASTPAAPTAAATLPVPPPTTTPPQPPPPSGPSITIAAVGDVSLAREVVSRMEQNGPAYPFALVTTLLDADITIANLEGALTERGDPWPKGYNFRTPPRFASGLSVFDLVSLANNHAMDYGAIGLLDTIDALHAAGVRYAGAGANIAEARPPVIIEANGLRVAFLAYAATPDEYGGFQILAWGAGPETPGLLIGSVEAIDADVRAARPLADFVVVVVHAGTEYRNPPDATQVALANAALAAGADAYIGHHAHVVQPVEQRGSQLIAWGLGNFVFDLDEVDLANIPVPRVSLVLKLTLTKGAGVTAWEALPVTIDDTQDRPRPATADEAATLRDLIGG
ncbi:MAG: CapA family protein [Dehalococcoidia bacterium]